MERRIMLWITVGVLFLVALYFVFQIGATGNAIVSSDGKIDMSGWTENEKMNYEMHGTIPARASGGSSSGSAQMVGGC
ncbi:MAG: hypothetical protein KJ879_02030 [Nanoarchaeota archaeon]|nr:hypothetical protein [Nanoarchaeota archaeon]